MMILQSEEANRIEHDQLNNMWPLTEHIINHLTLLCEL
jgi:hypothetical protein